MSKLIAIKQFEAVIKYAYFICVNILHIYNGKVLLEKRTNKTTNDYFKNLD